MIIIQWIPLFYFFPILSNKFKRIYGICGGLGVKFGAVDMNINLNENKKQMFSCTYFNWNLKFKMNSLIKQRLEKYLSQKLYENGIQHYSTIE